MAAESNVTYNMGDEAARINIQNSDNLSSGPSLIPPPVNSTDAEVPPPSYDSLFGQLKRQKSQATGPVDFTKGAFKIFCDRMTLAIKILCCTLCCGTCIFALPTAEIVIGSMYIDDCPLTDKFPVYLIVDGVAMAIVGLLTVGASIVVAAEDDDKKPGKALTAVGCCDGMFAGFVVAWFMWGSYMCFKVPECETEKDFRSQFKSCYTYLDYSPKYCHPTLHKFLFFVLIAKWALIALCFLLCCCGVCCALCCGSSDDGENNQTETAAVEQKPSLDTNSA